MGHRLHDYALVGQRIYAAAGVDPEKFMKQFDQLRRSTGAEIAAGDSFVVGARKVLADLARGAQAGDSLPGWKSWHPSGTVAVRRSGGGVVIGIRARAMVERLRHSGTAHRGEDWLPRNERELSGALYGRRRYSRMSGSG